MSNLIKKIDVQEILIITSLILNYISVFLAHIEVYSNNKVTNKYNHSSQI